MHASRSTDCSCSLNPHPALDIARASRLMPPCPLHLSVSSVRPDQGFFVFGVNVPDT